MKDPEHYYMTLLQLYLPWRNEDSLIDGHSSYKEKFDQVETEIESNIQRHDCFYGIFDDEDMINNLYESHDNDNEDVIDSEFGMLNPDLLDLEVEQDTNPSNSTVPSSTIENISISREEFYEMCSQLNSGQQYLFNYIMKFSQELILNSRNDVPDPEPFYLLLTGGAGVGKSFLVKCLVEYLKKTLKYRGQNFSKQPSVAVTASTGKAATNVDGSTLHSAFLLPVNLPWMKAPGRQRLQTLQETYEYLKTLVIDEISMVDKETFDNLNVWLRKAMKRDDYDFGAISMLLVGDFFQLPPSNKNYIFSRLTLNDAWFRFKMHELTEIVRQSSDPSFAELLNRLREGNQTEDDILEIRALEHTDTSDWPEDHVRLYITNALKDKHNDKSMARLLEEDINRKMYTFYAKDSAKDTRTGAHEVQVSPDTPITRTGGLPYCLKVCVGNTVMLTYNKDQHDKLINGSIGKVIHIQSSVQNGKASGTIYVKFEDETAGSKYKDSRLRGDLKQCVPITVRTNDFQYGRKELRAVRKQFPLVLAHALTIHKSQGSTLLYMTGDMDRTTKSGKGIVPVDTGQFYTLLSRATSRDRARLENFEERVIRVSDIVKSEMARMRKDCVFTWDHPLLQVKGAKVCLLNIVSWNLHIPHLLSDNYYFSHSNVFCFTETHTGSSTFRKIEEYDLEWRSIHHPTAEHGLSICYNTTSVVIEKEYPTISTIQMLPLLMRIEGELTLLVLVYRPPNSVPRDAFIYYMIHELGRLDEVATCRTIVLGDFNIDQMLPANVDAFQQFCDTLHFTQRSRYSTHIHGGILDLVFDQKKSDAVQWMPSPYSDHFVVIIDI